MSPLGRYLVETLVMLVGVAGLAVLLLVAGRRLGIGRPTGPMQLVGRLPLDGRRAVYLVRVGDIVYIVGASEGGLSKLGELPKDGLEFPQGDAVGKPFEAVLARVLDKTTAKPPPSA
jgi:flagellar protein FliO/FliZ